MDPKTLAIHGYRDNALTRGTVTPPIQLSTTYDRAPDGSYPTGFSYARKNNPNRDQLEEALAALEGGAACAAFAYRPAVDAAVVARLREAGAVIIGKTNLDQFATGLVGLRSPYGAPRNPLNAKLIPGGSSSGSAVAVATGLVPMALGTDTAGSGRVPALFNNIVLSC